MNSLDDTKIIELFFDRSEQAIDELSQKYGAILSKVALNILGNKQDTEECLNDAYLGTWNKIPPHKPNHLLSYVCKIVRNLAIKKYHANTASKRKSTYEVALDELENSLATVNSTEDEFNAIETAKIINNFLASLDRKNRIIFVRRYWLCDSIDDLARLFQTSNHNISVRLSRTREKLRKHLITQGVSL